jgi:hypothetical protein
MYLVLIETSGNQNYIFSTNKLKENIGASELTYQAGTRWVLEAVARPDENKAFEGWSDSSQLRKFLRNPALNPPIESGKKPIEILTAASGKALLLTGDEKTAKAIISQITRKALKEAPGLDIAGVYEPISATQNFGSEETLAKAIKDIHKKFEAVRSQRLSPVNRFLRLPIIADCAVSELPASCLETLNRKKAKPISNVSFIKRKVSPKAKDRLTALDERLSSQIDQILKENDDTESLSWLAIIHADGNGLGQIFMRFEEYLGQDRSNRNYIQKYREFSLSLDECTEAALKKALDIFAIGKTDEKDIAPIIPLIIGGDDLTAICDGRYALEFTREFLQEFERQTEKHIGITEIAKEAFGVGRLSACAGVAIVKRHFPFSVAYGLAESLIKVAKDVKRKVTCQSTENFPEDTPFPCSAIDFHILYDTSGIELSDIRSRLEPDSTTQLFNRPYIVSQDISAATEEGQEWAVQHAWHLLRDRVQWLNSNKSEQEDKAPISSAQSHAIRTALFLGKANADAKYQLIRQRYDLDKFAESDDKQSLFYQSADGIFTTSFLDALDAKDFLKLETTQDAAEAEQ